MKRQIITVAVVSALSGCAPSSSRVDGNSQTADSADANVLASEHWPLPPSPTSSPNAKMPPGPPPSMGQKPPGPPPGGFPPGGFAGGPGGPGKVVTGSGLYVLKNGEQLIGGQYQSSQDDQNVFRAQGDINASLSSVHVHKTAGEPSSNDAASFYGLNAAILALDNATLTINGGTVDASSEGSTGVFAYNGAVIHLNETEINVSGGNAGGIEVAGGGEIYANNLTVNSRVKAAIRSDRGGGKLVVNGGQYSTQGSMGAPAIYSTADIEVNNATLDSHNSEAVVIEGLNSVTIRDSAVTGRMDGNYQPDSNDVIRNVMLYQSMSGDAQNGTSRFTMQGGSLRSNNGDMFYVTNTDSVINLNQVILKRAANSKLLVVAGNSGKRGWGRVGANGGVCEMNLLNQIADGDIRVDPISALELNLEQGTQYTGAINPNGEQAQSLVVSLDNTSHWSLTADSYVTEFKGQLSQVSFNGHQIYVAGKPLSQ